MDKERSRFMESILEIDEFNLEKEWTRQPKLFFEWAKTAADARLAMDEAKAAVEVAKAEADSEVRANPQRYGIDGKMTERMVEAAVVQMDTYVEALKKYGEARNRYEVLSALVSALEQRKTALENLVKLHLASYYSEPRAPKDCEDGLEEMKKNRVFRPRRREEDD